MMVRYIGIVLKIEVDDVELLSKMTICAFSLASELVRAHTPTNSE